LTVETPVAERALLTGNEAVARGALEAGVRVAAGYPGTPSTEILETLGRCAGIDVGWSPNEKVALDVGLGASFGGARALVAMKHVGLNVASDTFMTAAYTGVGAGLVLVSADDPGMHSSQNEQDNRLYARFAGVPMLEPSDSEEAKRFTELGFDISEAFDTPVLLRYTTRVAHSRSLVQLGTIRDRAPAAFRRDPRKYVMLPGHAQARRPIALERLDRLVAYAEESSVTREETGDPAVGVVTSGIAYQYVREVLPDASVLKLGMSFPLPIGRIRAFAERVGRLFVVEELEPFLEDALRAAGLEVEGKAHFPRSGEFSPDVVRRGFVHAQVLAAPHEEEEGSAPVTTARPPVLCPGCPHVTPFLALRQLGAVVAGDIGCYTLAALSPLSAMDTCVAMGSSIGMATGLVRSGGASGPVVATIGDSTFLHAGIPALIDAVHGRVDLTVVILDNGTTAMTGGQPHPGTGKTLTGATTAAVDLAELCRAIGIEHVRVVDPYELGEVYVALESAIAHAGPAVVITNRPCVEAPTKVRDRPFEVVASACIACQLCMNLACPSITWTEEWFDGRRKVDIDAGTCTGCTVCAQMCPAGAIVPLTEWEDNRG
jgi:indolepyruvate ferredoxin oxidoreductase alpha subunit